MGEGLVLYSGVSNKQCMVQIDLQYDHAPNYEQNVLGIVILLHECLSVFMNMHKHTSPQVVALQGQLMATSSKVWRSFWGCRQGRQEKGFNFLRNNCFINVVCVP
eukprot:scaffold458426_cov15-Prasinocladus_malaysianus.AAC.1